MKKGILTLFIASLLLNLFFVDLSVYILVKKGGVTYIKSKVRPLHTKPSIITDSRYIEKVELFKSFPNSKEDIYFVGDSITERCSWSELFNNSSCKNRGIGSDTTEGVLNRLREVTEGHPKKVFIMIGINDIGKGVPLYSTKEHLKEIVFRIQSDSPGTYIYLQSLLPINKKLFNTNIKQSDIIELNQFIKGLAFSESCSYIDLFSDFLDSKGELKPDLTIDGLHINANGYYLWKRLIGKYIEEK